MRQGMVILLMASLLAAFAGPGLWLHQQLDHQQDQQHGHQHHDAGMMHNHQHDGVHTHGCEHHGHAAAMGGNNSTNPHSSSKPSPPKSHDDCSVCHLLLTVQSSTLEQASAVGWLDVVTQRSTWVDESSAHLAWVGFVSGRDPPLLHL